ncbi:feline leukemia virus subgroup C receptor-related protein 2 isoform X3 [Anopheles sinensis]|uniref:Feline leukemia virus subgroup C receptor-related protein 2 isoform X3 n=1 Tax=Anopheles sinensis TaxID=74873 RepID=A0A084W2T1_ANOSI|nr:feline leukemia virus subgroup C receptor-related protein 2 isoform X3 [Anopheles sinensis]
MTDRRWLRAHTDPEDRRRSPAPQGDTGTGSAPGIETRTRNNEWYVILVIGGGAGASGRDWVRYGSVTGCVQNGGGRRRRRKGAWDHLVQGQCFWLFKCATGSGQALVAHVWRQTATQTV